MKIVQCILLVVCSAWLAETCPASDTYDVTIDASKAPTVWGSHNWGAIPAHYVGLAFEMGSERSNSIYGYQFNTTNVQYNWLFQNMGVVNIRMGGGSSDTELDENGFEGDGYTGVDNFMDFCKSNGVNVIYDARQYCTNQTQITTYTNEGTQVAVHIAGRNPDQLDYFIIGNEPQYYYSGPPVSGHPDPYCEYYESANTNGWKANWRVFADSVNNAVSGATFGGPETGDDHMGTKHWYNGVSWTQQFAEDKASGNIPESITDIDQHNYVGGSSANYANAAALIAGMLGTTWDSSTNEWMWENILTNVVSAGWGYRMTECDDITGGITGASDRFCAALWALDYMWGWADRDCHGVDFENNEWIPTCTVQFDGVGNFYMAPKGLALAAFSLAGPNGTPKLVEDITNPQNVPVNSYACSNNIDGVPHLYITIINKSYGPNYVMTNTNGVDLAATITVDNFSASNARYMLMVNDSGDHGYDSTNGTLGGAHITNNSMWNGAWTTATISGGQCSVTVPGCGAAVVDFY